MHLFKFQDVFFQMYSSKWQNISIWWGLLYPSDEARTPSRSCSFEPTIVFVKIAKCISPNCKMYLCGASSHLSGGSSRVRARGRISVEATVASDARLRPTLLATELRRRRQFAEIRRPANSRFSSVESVHLNSFSFLEKRKKRIFKNHS